MTSATRLTPVFRPFATHTPITAVETEAAGYAAVSVYYFSSRTISSSGTIEDVTQLTNLGGQPPSPDHGDGAYEDLKVTKRAEPISANRQRQEETVVFSALDFAGQKSVLSFFCFGLLKSGSRCHGGVF